MIFWTTATLLTLAVTVILGLTLLRPRAADAEHPAAYDLRVYRDQLKEVDRDLARGVLGEDDAARIRAEVSRRVLTADAQLQQAATTGSQPRGATLLLVGLCAAALIGGSLLLYPTLGAPGMRDTPLSGRLALSDELRRTRPSQTEYEATLPARAPATPAPEFAELMTRLRTTVAERPDDLQGHALLARNEAALGNLPAAYAAQQQVIRIKASDATAQDYMVLADLLITAAQGYVSPQAEAALKSVLARQPSNPAARYYTGLMMIQNDRPDVAFRLWEALLREGPATAPWIAPIRDRIEELAWRAGVKYTAPPAAPMLSGPTAQDMANAADMTPEERQDMVRGMVAQLSERLATQGGTPQEWSRLISAYGVLGETDRAAAIWGEAQQVFGPEPGALAIVRQGAEQAGVADAAPLKGPTAEDMQNAAEMAPEDRQAMIRTMVDQLSERLSSDGGSPAEWVRLIGAQNVLGDSTAARAAYDGARAAYADDTAALARIDAAARAAGLTE